LDPHLPPQTNVNSKCIKDLNMRSRTIEILDQNVGQKLLDQNSFCLVARGLGGREGVEEREEAGGRKDPNIACTYE
jgi:hypothetical protein